MRDLLAATADVPGLRVEELPPYPTLPGLVVPLAAAAAEAVSALQAEGLQTAVLVTAHGLPERYVRDGDPYVDHVGQTFEAFRREAKLPVPVTLGFQSRIGPVRWVGPQVDEVVERLARGGTRALVVVPATFVCEHLETRYDLDLVLRSVAWEHGIRRYTRIPTVSTAPAFIQGLADHVRAAR